MEITAINFKQRATDNFANFRAISNFTIHLCFIGLIIRIQNQIIRYCNLNCFKSEAAVIQEHRSQKDYFHLRVD